MTGPDDSSDLAILLERTGSGDEHAFATIYQRTSAKLFGISLRICADSELARTALQECYVRIWNSALDYNPQTATPISWMAAIVRSRSIAHKRARMDRPLSGGTPIDVSLFASGANPLMDADLSVELRALMLCLGTLPVERREMLLLAYYAGWSREELAQKYALPVTTVKTVLRSSLVTLEGCLDER